MRRPSARRACCLLRRCPNTALLALCMPAFRLARHAVKPRTSGLQQARAQGHAHVRTCAARHSAPAPPQAGHPARRRSTLAQSARRCLRMHQLRPQNARLEPHCLPAVGSHAAARGRSRLAPRTCAAPVRATRLSCHPAWPWLPPATLTAHSSHAPLDAPTASSAATRHPPTAGAGCRGPCAPQVRRRCRRRPRAPTQPVALHLAAAHLACSSCSPISLLSA